MKKTINNIEKWGKGGSIIRFRKNKAILCFLAFFLLGSLSFQQIAFAGRVYGKVAKFDFGKFALAQGIGVVCFVGGSAISQGLGSVWNSGGALVGNSGTFASGFNKTFGGGFYNVFSSFATAYHVNFATGQLNNAAYSMGRYYGWDPKGTLFVSTLLGSALGGGLNPGQFGVSGIWNGVALGAISGTVQGGILASVANDKGQVPFWAGPVAGLAGGMVTNSLVGGFSSFQQNNIIANGERTGVILNSSQGFSFGNKFNFGNALNYSMRNMIQSLPTTAINIGVGAATQHMDWQDRQIVQAAASGLNPIVNTVSGIGMEKLGINKAFPITPTYINSDNPKVPMNKLYTDVSNPSAYVQYNYDPLKTTDLSRLPGGPVVGLVFPLSDDNRVYDIKQLAVDPAKAEFGSKFEVFSSYKKDQKYTIELVKKSPLTQLDLKPTGYGSSYSPNLLYSPIKLDFKPTFYSPSTSPNLLESPIQLDFKYRGYRDKNY